MAVLVRAPAAVGSLPGRRARRRRAAVVALAALTALAALAAPRPTRADESRANEYAVKAAFLYNFAKFAEWPADAFVNAHAPIVIGVVGVDPFGPMLDAMLESKTAHGRAFTVRRLERAGQAVACHLVFVAHGAESLERAVLRAVGNLPVLTVGESADFIASGGVINFQVESNRVVFEVGAEKSASAPVRLSSQLLKLARFVRAGRGGPNG